MTASYRQKVEQIISTGDMPAIEGSYERDQAIGLLEDYASHPDSGDLVVERAQNAVEQLTDSQEGER